MSTLGPRGDSPLSRRETRAAWLVAAALLALGAASFEPAPEPIASRPLDLGASSAAEFALVRGVGPVLAGRIVHTREILGSSFRPDDLLAVDGVGENMLDDLSPRFAPTEAGSDAGR